jgi:diketogulonate reductase-like aldo/keto reductase
MSLKIDDRLELNNGILMPNFGFGTYKLTGKKKAVNAVRAALDAGYRLIDSARMYDNEEEIGEAVNESGIPREEIFITTKIWTNEHGYKNTINAFKDSLGKLNSGYIDLFLIHWPSGGKRKETWEAMQEILETDECRAIGVSNFTERHIEEIIEDGGIVPAVNQVEFSPFLYQKDLLNYCRGKGIQLEAYSPLGRGNKIDDNRIKPFADKYGKTNAQVILRWVLQHKVIVIPKSSHEMRIKENAGIFDFELDEAEMKALNSLNEGLRYADDPAGID